MKEDETKKQLKEIKKRSDETKKDFKVRCLMVIETLVGGDIDITDIEKLKTTIYKIAHVGIGICNSHDDWVRKTEDFFYSFEKAGLL